MGTRCGYGERAGVLTGTDRKANTLEPIQGCGAPELLDLRLFEDGSERSCAPSFDKVISKTASQEQEPGWER